ncbi:hypothetical protein Hanom_Chr05g00431771 [Helianthus anomalus]
MFVDCYLSRYHMILYNPFTGESKTVPPPGSYDSLCNYVQWRSLTRMTEGEGGGSKTYIHKNFYTKTIYITLLSEKFGGSGTPPRPFYTSPLTMCMDLVIKTHSLPLILALDIKTMVFSEIKVPDGYRLNRLGTYNRRLCMICSQKNVERHELGAMNEHGFGESLCTLASSFALLISHAFAYWQMCILDDGKLLMSVSSPELINDDMFKDSCKAVNVSRLEGRLQSLEYVENTISPSDICTVSI